MSSFSETHLSQPHWRCQQLNWESRSSAVRLRPIHQRDLWFKATTRPHWAAWQKCKDVFNPLQVIQKWAVTPLVTGDTGAHKEVPMCPTALPLPHVQHVTAKTTHCTGWPLSSLVLWSMYFTMQNTRPSWRAPEGLMEPSEGDFQFFAKPEVPLRSHWKAFWGTVGGRTHP